MFFARPQFYATHTLLFLFAKQCLSYLMLCDDCWNYNRVLKTLHGTMMGLKLHIISYN